MTRTNAPVRTVSLPMLLFNIVVLLVSTATVHGEPAPVPFRTITPAEAPDRMGEAFLKIMDAKVRHVDLPDAEWLQLRFNEYHLGKSSRLVITAVESGETQTFTQSSLAAWQGLSAIFDSQHLRIELQVGSDEVSEVFFKIGEVIVGEPEGGVERRMLPGGEENIPPEESLCGTDNRVASNDRRVGRIMPVGCTGWIIGANSFLTAGHCVGAAMQILQFNVPASNSNGTVNNPPVHDQYAIDTNSIVFNNDGTDAIGDDWAVFRVAQNTQTNLLPMQAQGARYAIKGHPFCLTRSSF